MKISTTMKEKIKSYEGLSLKACKCVPTERYYTIGYGHYGADVKKDQVITKSDADKMFDKDIAAFDKYVNNVKICPHINNLNQDMYDALISFCYNCGPGNLQKLCKNTLANIPNAMLSYNKSGGKVLPGLTRRRNEEAALFKKGLAKIKGQPSEGKAFTGILPTKILKKGSKGNDVGYLQIFLNWYGKYNLKIDNIFGKNTANALIDFQKREGLVADAIFGPKSLNVAKNVKK